MSKPILTPEEEANVIANVLDDPEDEIGFWSKRLLQIHYENLPEKSSSNE